MDKVSIGIPIYGDTPKDVWVPLSIQMMKLKEMGIELGSLITIGSMMTDISRNKIADIFLKSDSEWLMWVDNDNVHDLSSIRYLLDTDKTLVTGLYTKRDDEQEALVYKLVDRHYKSVPHVRGELIEADAAGMGACLVHRSVFEDIKKNYRVFERQTTGVILVHKDDIVGDVMDGSAHDTDGKVVDGVLHDRLRLPRPGVTFPFFRLEYQRTEDYVFFEQAKRCGHPLWVDTSVTVGHIGNKIYHPDDAWKGAQGEINV